jgi:hypothetical protein
MSVFAPVDMIADQHAAMVEFQIQQGSDWNDSFQILEATDAGNVPYPLTDCTIEMAIRPSYDHAAVIARLSTATGNLIIEDAAQGIVQIFVLGGTVASYPAGRWTHVTRVLKAGEARALAYGPVIILPANY